MKKKFNQIELYRFANYGYRMDKGLEKLFKALFFLTITLFVGTLQNKVTDWEYVNFVKEANSINTYDLNEYVRFYIKDLKKNGFNVDSLLRKQNKKSIRFLYMGPNTIGRADGMFDNDEIDIKVSPLWWNKLNKAEKLYVIYHEAGHDFWFKLHGSSWIMAKSKKATGKITYEKIYRLRKEYFESIRKGNKRPRYWYRPVYHSDCTANDNIYLD